jgi:predicted ABC-type transport system involved in lysophospholipase L1 biosynthesis ATPase subunit
MRIGEEVQDLLLQLNQEKGIGVVVATHNREFAKRVGKQAELREGQLFPL